MPCSALCDCYVSLHRSEGLGLTMAEAMGLRKPVIATAYSGNLDFMTLENSFLVDYRTSRVPADSEPYPEGTPWADPSLDAAAELMRLVVHDPAEAANRARRGREDILTRHGVAACAPMLRDRIDHLRSSRRETIAVPEHSVVPPSSLTAAPPAPVEATLNAARSMLTPGIGLPETAKFRGLRLRLQSALLRALRPVLVAATRTQQPAHRGRARCERAASRRRRSAPCRGAPPTRRSGGRAPSPCRC